MEHPCELKNIFYSNKPQGKLLFVFHFDLNKYQLHHLILVTRQQSIRKWTTQSDLSQKTISGHSETISMTYINKLSPIIYATKCLLVRHDCTLHKTSSYMKH